MVRHSYDSLRVAVSTYGSLDRRPDRHPNRHVDGERPRAGRRWPDRGPHREKNTRAAPSRRRVRRASTPPDLATPGSMLCWSRRGIAVTRGPVSHTGVTVARTRHFRRWDPGWCPVAGCPEPRRAGGMTAPDAVEQGSSATPNQPQDLQFAAPPGPAPAGSDPGPAHQRSHPGPLHGRPTRARPPAAHPGPPHGRPTRARPPAAPCMARRSRRPCPHHPACPQPRRKPPHEPGRPEIRRILRR